ncbi:protein phosphatase 2C 29 [Populus alba]|uniref:protein phosphatase 2C 29 n=1 Tax=Populus alba TaxID=43335 RepID=UPI00158C575A|nr:protein phosphatase 2C 29-like [Populus alba]
MGSGLSTLFPCFKPPNNNQQDLIFTASEPLDETLGHSFCYVRSSNRFLSPTPSDRFVSPSHSLRFSPARPVPVPETGFKSISGASVSANTSTPRTVLQLDNIYDDAIDVINSSNNTSGFVTYSAGGARANNTGSIVNNVNGFESTASFSALPLQPVPRGGGGFFLSGPIERGALSGPLDPNTSGTTDGSGGRVHFSAPLGGIYVKNKKRRGKGMSGFKKAMYRNISEKSRPWVVPVLNFVNRRENSGTVEEMEGREEGDNVQWALGKAGEDRVHVVVSEEHGWLFVGIYDGFNGPDAPEFLMGNLYRAVFNELQGLFWEVVEEEPQETIHVEGIENKTDPLVEKSGASDVKGLIVKSECNLVSKADPLEEIYVKKDDDGLSCGMESNAVNQDRVKRVTFQPEETEGTASNRRRRLWEFLAEDDLEDGLDLSGSDRFAFSVDDAISVGNAGSAVSRRWLLLSKLKQGLSKHKERKLFPWKFGLEGKEKVEVESSKVEERVLKRKWKAGPVDHDLVLGALSRALEVTELAYLDMTDKVLDTNPELALMGSCLLAVLMRDEDVYVMNVGDSRAIVAQYEPQEVGSSVYENELSTEAIIETRLTALQLSTDHSTSIEEEVIRIKNEHPDDNQCIVNDRVKGRLKVTRAFGAGFLKRPKLNDALLEMFRNEYIGTAPYISCSPSLHHHQLCPRDQFLVLSSDGLYQYLTNQEVVFHVESFMEKFPEGDPAQHLIEELLSRAAKKAGMDFHELLDIPQGDRRKYHDDVTVMVISLEGRIWKSSGKYL